VARLLRADHDVNLAQRTRALTRQHRRGFHPGVARHVAVEDLDYLLKRFVRFGTRAW
jgi:hypothetical protein